ncbi:MAG: hypothetical protein KL863_07525 [Rhizobium sp.]|nr:hypothetical protein [Rhizobium sp.]
MTSTATPNYARNADVTLHNALPALREDRVLAGAQWLADLVEAPQNVIPELRQRFELSTGEAISAIRRAELMRIYRKAHG